MVKQKCRIFKTNRTLKWPKIIDQKIPQLLEFVVIRVNMGHYKNQICLEKFRFFLLWVFMRWFSVIF